MSRSQKTVTANRLATLLFETYLEYVTNRMFYNLFLLIIPRKTFKPQLMIIGVISDRTSFFIFWTFFKCRYKIYSIITIDFLPKNCRHQKGVMIVIPENKHTGPGYQMERFLFSAFRSADIS